MKKLKVMYKLFKIVLSCYAYLDGFDFLLLFFEIFELYVEIIGVICRKKYELLNNLNYLLQNFKLYENYMEII